MLESLGISTGAYEEISYPWFKNRVYTRQTYVFETSNCLEAIAALAFNGVALTHFAGGRSNLSKHEVCACCAIFNQPSPGVGELGKGWRSTGLYRQQKHHSCGCALSFKTSTLCQILKLSFPPSPTSCLPLQRLRCTFQVQASASTGAYLHIVSSVLPCFGLTSYILRI